MTSRRAGTLIGITIALSIAGLAGLYTRGGDQPEATPVPGSAAPPRHGKATEVKQKASPSKSPEGALPALLVSQAQFETGPDGKPAAGPAKLVIWRTDGADWYEEVIEDEGSNVFHKAIGWRGGILTIAGAQFGHDPPLPAQLRVWKPSQGGWKPTTLWEQRWEGKFQRLRDLEIGDVDGDGKEDIVLATHDMGVVAVGTENADGTWTFVELDETPDTFVHEIEIGDVDGDGRNEFYATPSERNQSSGESQPGKVVRYDMKGGLWARSDVVTWDVSHAKEILVTDLDGDGRDELYVVREGHVTSSGAGATELRDPVRIARMDPVDGAWESTGITQLQDHLCRFLVPGDVDGDGRTDLVAAGYKSGLWLLRQQPDGTFENLLIDEDSGGFEHATHLADLNDDGELEIYVAADDQRELRCHTWNGHGFDEVKIAAIPPGHITWNIQDAKL